MSRGEILFLAAILACAAAAVALLATETTPGGREQGPRIGTVTFKNHFAGRKLSGEVIWNNVDQNAPVYNLDSIRTGTDSSAVIHLDNAIDIRLAEESLILLDFAPAQTRLKLIGGSVVVQTGSAGAAPSVLLSTSAGQVTLTSGTLAAVDSGSKLDLRLTDGSAVFSNGSSVQEMSGNAILSSSGTVVAAPSIRPTAPADGEVVFTSVDEARVQFRWHEDNPGPTSPPLFLTVAGDRAFTQIEFQGRVSGGQSSVALQPGTHYWQLSTGTNPDTSGIAAWFTAQTLPAPRLIAPLGKTFTVPQGKAGPVPFAWTPSEAASAYRLEITNRASSAPARPPVTTTLSSLTIDALGEGAYSWTVTALAGPLPAVESASAPGAFSISGGALAAPRIRTVGAGSGGVSGRAARFSVDAVENGAVLASWDDVEGAARYVATVSRDAKGTDVVATVATRSNVLQVDKPLDKGTYYVSVQAVTEVGISGSSPGVPIEVVDAIPPELVAPPSGMRLDPTARDVPFRWSDPNWGHVYRLQVAADQSFTSLIVDKAVEGTREEVLHFEDGVAGNLFWRVSLLDDQQKLVSQSAMAGLFLPKILAAPHPVSPEDGSVMDINTTEKIVFRWEPVEGATDYQVILHRTTAGLRSVVQSWTSTTPQIVFDRFEDLATGPFSWEVRAVERSEGAISGQSRVVSSYFRIEQSSPLPAPAITIRKIAVPSAGQH